MSLRWKLFFSHFLVMVVTLFVLSISAAYVAPRNFSYNMEHMDMENMMDDSGNEMMMGMGMESHTISVEELNASFRTSVNNALLKAGVVALLVALGISWFVSSRIVRPVKSLASASQRIAGGHYEERLPIREADELGELTQHFNQMAEALAATEQMRQQLIGDVSHELKTPLTSIMGLMEGLQDGLLEPTSESFELVHHEAERLHRLVQDLQELSRTEARQIVFDLLPCQPSALVEFGVKRLTPQYLEKGIILEQEFSEHLPLVSADAERTGQIIINLLGNALQYTPVGGKVAIRASKEEGFVRFSIQDSGIGLSQADLERVFQRFYRVDKSRSRVSGGSGIGLTIARHFVESQGGRIWVESNGIGSGSTFSFTLPIA